MKLCDYTLWLKSWQDLNKIENSEAQASNNATVNTLQYANIWIEDKYVYV